MQQTTTLETLSTLELKCLNMCHLFFNDPEAFSMMALPEFMLESYFCLSTSIASWFFQISCKYGQIKYIASPMIYDVHLSTVTTTIGSCKISQFLSCLLTLNILNCPPSWTPLGWLAHTFPKKLCTLQIACLLMLWIFFLLKNQ